MAREDEALRPTGPGYGRPHTIQQFFFAGGWTVLAIALTLIIVSALGRSCAQRQQPLAPPTVTPTGITGVAPPLPAASPAAPAAPRDEIYVRISVASGAVEAVAATVGMLGGEVLARSDEDASLVALLPANAFYELQTSEEVLMISVLKK